MGLTVVEHPIIWDKMTKLRDKETCTKEFRELTAEISAFLGYEALREARAIDMAVTTPVGPFMGKVLATKIAIIPVLRAGIGMVDGLLTLLPTAKVGHIGMYRDPDTLKPHVYYTKFPADISERQVLLVDPMLATGGTAADSIRLLKDHGAKMIRFICLVSCDEGVKKLTADHPDVAIFAASHDNVLNDQGYIVPGLGDAGDRMFGTK